MIFLYIYLPVDLLFLKGPDKTSLTDLAEWSYIYTHNLLSAQDLQRYCYDGFLSRNYNDTVMTDFSD